MRTNIVMQGADELTYEIREIVEFGNQLKALGKDMIWENIGDPVAKGEKIPDWIKRLINDALKDDKTFAYSPTKGLLETRKFISKLRATQGLTLDPEDILFFNGLGDAVSKVYTYLNRNARVIGPSPAYPTHSSAEAGHAGSYHLTYELNPHRNWLPDLNDLRNKVTYNPAIAGILIINPDNPTGMIYPKHVLKEIVAIAKAHDLFLICDEIYSNIYYGDEPFVQLAELLDGVPAIIMKGLSKEVPWPGARCGWIEVYHKDSDPTFARYIKTINDAKMLEVCSTTLPQKVLPAILSNPQYAAYLQSRRDAYSERADIAHKALRKIADVSVVKPSGAFYVTLVFDESKLSHTQSLPVENAAMKELVEQKAATLAPHHFDKRFAYYLMAAYGLCVVPLSGFNTDLCGFRMTLLEENSNIFEKTLEILQKAIPEYLAS
jgi:alanine-synthesizing transaminase